MMKEYCDLIFICNKKGPVMHRSFLFSFTGKGSHPHPDDQNIIQLLQFTSPLFNCFIEDLLLPVQGFMVNGEQEFLELFVFEFFSFISSKLVGITIGEQINGIAFFDGTSVKCKRSGIAMVDRKSVV